MAGFEREAARRRDELAVWNGVLHEALRSSGSIEHATEVANKALDAFRKTRDSGGK